MAETNIIKVGEGRVEVNPLFPQAFSAQSAS